MLYLSSVGFNLPGFTEYLTEQTPSSHSNNPWTEIIWKQVTNGCPWNGNNTQTNRSTNCDVFTSLASLPSIYQPDTFSTKYYDCVMVYAKALHNLLVTLCPSATGATLRKCIYDNNLYDFIKNRTFQSSHGPISFDELGNSLTSYYVIKHFRQRPNTSFYESVEVGKWFRQNSSLTINISQINWTKFNRGNDVNSSVHSA